jgi:hypothetical protein
MAQVDRELFAAASYLPEGEADQTSSNDSKPAAMSPVSSVVRLTHAVGMPIEENKPILMYALSLLRVN